jgi:4,5-DOPA dioxygenase extradiol
MKSGMSKSRPLSRRRFALGAFAGALGLGAAALASRRKEIPMTTPASRAPRAPSLFVAHGAPTLALDAEKGADFRRWADGLAPPRAILMVSAHWEAAPVTLGTLEQRELLYDFYGFPEPLYQVRYPAPGAPELGRRVEALLLARGQKVAQSPTRPLDHGAWVPLVHMFPGADVPVLQISMPSELGPRALFELGQSLASLRDEGVLVIGSGNLTHNLRRLDWRGAGAPPAWATEFDGWIADVLRRRDVDTLIDYRHKAPALRDAHPTEEHFQPLLVSVGAAAEDGAVSFPIEGFEYGSLSRRSVQLG